MGYETFQDDPNVHERVGSVGEKVCEVANVSVFEHEGRDGQVIVNYGNPAFTADELREIADEVDEYYAEPTFEDRVNEVADEYGLEIDDVMTYENFPADAKLSLPDDFNQRINLFSELEEFCQVVSFYDDHVNVEEAADE
jgi:hypothetical protein